MAIKISSTRTAAEYVKMLCFADSGIGKTTLIGTAPRPLVINTESGLMPLANKDIDVLTCKSLTDIYEAYDFVMSPEADEYETICLDSISDIAEAILSENKATSKDGRAAYGKLNDDIADIVRAFRDIDNKHIYMTAKMTRIEDTDTGIAKYKPMLPGRTLIQQIPYWFDIVCCLHVGVDEESSETFRYLQTQPSLSHDSKDRSGKLDNPEIPDLGLIFNKITGKVKKDETVIAGKKSIQQIRQEAS